MYTTREVPTVLEGHNCHVNSVVTLFNFLKLFAQATHSDNCTIETARGDNLEKYTVVHASIKLLLLM